MASKVLIDSPGMAEMGIDRVHRYMLPDKKAKPVLSKDLCIDMCTPGFSDLPPPLETFRFLRLSSDYSALF